MADRHVLVADDTEDMRSLLEAVLGYAGFEVTLASDGAEAFDLWTEHGRDLFAVILDHRMPEMNGLEVATRILAEAPEQRVILFSAQLDDELRTRAEQVGCRAALTKMQVTSLPTHPAMQDD